MKKLKLPPLFTEKSKVTELIVRTTIIIAILSLFVFAGIYLFDDDTPTDQNPILAIEETVLSDIDQEEQQSEEMGGKIEGKPREDDCVFEGQVSSGDTVSVILQDWLEPSDIHSMVAACKDVFGLHKIKPGQPYSVYQDDKDMFKFIYEIDKETKLIVTRDEEGTAFSAVTEEIDFDTRLAYVKGVISSSLFNAMAEQGETPALAVRLAEIFAWEVNFIRDIRAEDTFSVLIEKRYRYGKFFGYGRVLAATFTNQGRVVEGYAHRDSFGNDQFFNADGDSLRRAFLKAPLSFTRISSGFSSNRLHPILKTWRSHPAIDYAAPQGTPIKTVGDGRITFVGRDKGAGNYIKIQHHEGFETMYLHMSRFAKGMKKGKAVSQGDVIGYVGSTGYATGPHLDFRMKKNGKWVNPEKILAPRAKALTEEQKVKFKNDRDIWREYISGDKDITAYQRGDSLL